MAKAVTQLARTGRQVASRKPHRAWTAVITVAGYNPMAATLSERDLRDDQIMQAAHDALRLMRSAGAQVGLVERPDGAGMKDAA